MVHFETKNAGMNIGIEGLFTAIRESSSAKHWSRGIELCRRSSFCREEGEEDKIVLRLAELDRTVARVVSFWPGEGDWHCDCQDKDDPCVHIVATIIALKQAKENGKDFPLAERPSYKVAYRFTRKVGFLYFDRVIVSELGKPFRLTSSLIALATGRVKGPKISPTKEDLAVDLLLKDFQNGLVAPLFMPRLLVELSLCKDISIDGEPVQCGRDRTGFIARIEDTPSGVRLFGMQDPSIKETFRNGAALCQGDILRPFGHGKLLPDEIKMLAEGRLFGLREIHELVAELLPSLEQKLVVENCSTKLPKQIRVPPRLIFNTEKNGIQLIVVPQIVYGDPIIAYIIRGRMECSGQEVPVRDEKEERRLQNLLQRDAGFLVLEEARVFEGEHAVEFVEKMQQSGVSLVGSAVDSFRKYSLLSPRIDIHNDKAQQFSFDMQFETLGGEKHVDSLAVLQAWRKGQQLVPLLEGGFAPLPKEWLSRYGNILQDLLLAQGERGTLHPCLYSELVEISDSLDQKPPDQILNMKKRLDNFSGLTEPKLPSDLHATLRSYQKEGVAWLHFMQENFFGALLADDMGLGKTLQAICVLNKPSLVVAPTSVIYNWEREINKFRPELKVCVYHGLKRTLSEDAEVVLTTYALLRQDESLLTSKAWEVAVLDEAQNIKNPDSQVAKAAFNITSRFRITLTGTPIENSLEDIWSQFHFLNRGILGSRKAFLEYYMRPISQGDEATSLRLKRRLRPFILRRLKSEVASELPERSNVVLYCELNDEERNTYKALLAGTNDEVLQKLNNGKDMFQILEVLLRLRQAACHRGLIPGQQAETSSKVERLLACLKESVAEGHKALVFSQWTSLLDLIELALKKEGLAFDRIDGSTKNRGEIVDRFQSQKDLQVLLLSLKAAGTGLNLTAADHVFIVDPWWNPAIEEQAADRAHRIGQTKPVMVYRLVSKDTVEEKILLLKEKKKALASAVIASGEGLSITREDLLALFA